RPSSNAGSCLDPLEVVAPAIAMGVEKRDADPALRILGIYPIGLGPVAHRAPQGQVVLVGTSTESPGQHISAFEERADHCVRAEAIAATPASALPDPLAQCR